jgi:hypothetical protein
VCKQLFIIEVIGDGGGDQADDTANTTRLIHALMRIQPRYGQTIQLLVDIHDIHLTTLLDSRSTYNFIDTEAATWVGITLRGHAGLRVIVANSDHLQSPGYCRGLMISIGDEQFNIDCYDLTMGSYHMVLNVQWLESLRPILWDFCNRTIQFVRNGHRVC